MPQPRFAHLEVLNGWKDIANYLGKGVRTVQRYEREMGLPVRRPAGRAMGSVIATKAEMDAWVNASPIRAAFRLTQPTIGHAAIVRELHLNMEELHRLRGAAAQLQEELRRSYVLLYGTITAFAKQPTGSSSSEPRVLADVLPFDPKKKIV